MYNNAEYTALENKHKDYAKYRKQMRRIKKSADIAFIINIPIVLVNLIVFITGLISFDINNFMFPSFLSILAVSVLTVLSTYKKSKIASFLMIILYQLLMTTPVYMLMTIMYIPASLIYIVFIKSLFDEDKLKKIEGYPLFEEKISIYSDLYSVDNTVKHTEQSENKDEIEIPVSASYEMEEISLPHSDEE